MQRLFLRYGIMNRRASWDSTGRIVHRLFAAKTSPAAAIERQERLRDTSNDLNPTTVTGLASVVSRSSTISTTDSTVSSEAVNVFDIPEASFIPEVTKDKTPLPFEDIPGPLVLKIIEKYWRYVPLFGTQLICSLLINRVTLGQLKWNRNVTPLKYLFNEYGPIVRIHGPFAGDIVMIHRPEHIAEVYKEEGEAPVRSGIDVLQHYRLHHRKYRLPGPFTMQGTEWTGLRKKLEKPFAHQLTQYCGKLEMICDELVQRIRKIRNRQDEVPGDFDQDLSRWGMECFATFILNKRLGFLEPSGTNAASEPARIIEALNRAHAYLTRCETGFQVWRFFETPFTKKLFASCDVIDGVIGKYVRQAQNKLRSHTESTNKGKISNSSIEDDSSPVLEKLLLINGMLPEDISTLLMDMIILGVQATTNSEAFLLYYLAKNPRVQRRVYEEVVTAIPSKGTSLTQYSFKEMPYLRACMKECLRSFLKFPGWLMAILRKSTCERREEVEEMAKWLAQVRRESCTGWNLLLCHHFPRLRPAFPYVTRVLPKPITLHGYTIPKGTYIIMANQVSSHREENFEEPEKFKPERWISNKTEFSDKQQEFSSLPFGHGVRSCLGKQMAEAQMMMLTAKLIREFRIEYDYANISSNYMMVNVPNKPLRFRFMDRD